MTFILAIQLQDSVIVAADKRSIQIHSSGDSQLDLDETRKLHLWKNGIITGSGELHTIQLAVAFLDILTSSNIQELPNCLRLSRIIKKLKFEHHQIDDTKLIYSEYSEFGAQLYSIESEKNNEHRLRKFEANEISIWMYDPNILPVIDKIKILYSNLKPLSHFKDILDWANFYLPYIGEIYSEQSKYDKMMSSNFDVYFQTVSNYYVGNFENKTELGSLICTNLSSAE